MISILMTSFEYLFKLFLSKNIIHFISFTENLNGIDGYLSVKNQYFKLSTPIVSLTINISLHKIIFAAKAFPPKYDHVLVLLYFFRILV